MRTSVAWIIVAFLAVLLLIAFGDDVAKGLKEGRWSSATTQSSGPVQNLQWGHPLEEPDRDSYSGRIRVRRLTDKYTETCYLVFDRPDAIAVVSVPCR